MDIVLLSIGIIIIISSMIVRISKKFGIPVLVVYIGFGMILGSSDVLHFDFHNYEIAEHIGILALCYILFGGALEMNFRHVKSVIAEGTVLASLGVFLTAFIIAMGLYYMTPFSLLECFLIGSIISSTDAAAVISIFQFSSAKIPRKLESVLKLESGSNDPTAVTLVILFISLLQSTQQSSGIIAPIISLFTDISIGFFAGIIFGKIGEWALSRFSVGIFELNHILILGLVSATYSATNLFHGNGFLAVYILGLYMSRSHIAYKNSMTRFYNTLSWIMQITMFILLGLLVTPNLIISIWKEALMISFILIFIARPVTVFVCMKFFKNYTIKDKIFISWGGLKGAVPIIFATYPIVAGIPNGIVIFHIVFVVVIVSVLLQGTTLDFLAQKLGLNHEEKGSHIDTSLDLEKLEYIENSLVQIEVLPQSIFLNTCIRDLNMPHNLLIMSIKRDDHYISPKGDTVLLEGDILFIMTPERSDFIDDLMSDKHLKRFQQNLIQILVVDESSFLGKKVEDINLPSDARIISIRRDNSVITEHNTDTNNLFLKKGDIILITSPERNSVIENYLQPLKEHIIEN